jgi:hypothetical protein
MRRIAVRGANVHGHDSGTSRAALSKSPHGAFDRIGAALGGLRRWWTFGRHYHPEQRYMRGRRPTTRP